MANIIKIPHIQRNLIPFSNIRYVRTYCTPYNFTYSMNASEHEWGEWTPTTPAWASHYSWMNLNFIPYSSDPSWSLVDDGTTVRISPNGGGGIIHHYNYYYSQPAYISEITCYIVAKPSTVNQDSALLRLSCDISDPTYGINLFSCASGKIGIDYFLNDNISASRYIDNIVGPVKSYHIFVFKGIRNEINQSDFTINVDGTSDSFKAPSCFGFVSSTFPHNYQTNTSWDIKLIAFLPVAESDNVIANNVNVLRMMYNP